MANPIRCGTSGTMAQAASIAQRIESLRSSGFERYLRRLVLRVSLGGWFELYDLFMAAYISLGMVREKLFTVTGTGVGAFAGFVSAGFAGMFVGTLAFGWLSDRFGRRATFSWSLVFYSVATFAMALMPTAPLIDALRFLAGIGIGVQIITIDTYVTEITPAPDRGRLIAFSQFVSYTAVPAVALLAALLVPHQFGMLAGWRIVALVGALGAIFVWPIRAGLPESPRWLASHGRLDDAERVVARFEAASGVQEAPKAGGTGEDGLGTRVAGPATNIFEIFRPPYVARTVMLVSFNFFQTIGFYGFASWVPLLLYESGVGYVRDLQYVLVIALANPFGPVAAMYAADRIQRKWQIVTLALAIALFGLAFAHARSAAAIIVLGVFITLSNNWFSSAFHAYQAELYPTRIRALAVGFVYSWSRFSAIFSSVWVALALKHYGVGGVFALIALAMVVAAAVIAGLGQRTNLMRLEALSP